MNASPEPRNSFYSETPVVLNSLYVRDLLEYIAELYDRSWIEVLLNRAGWSEYGLYFQFCELRCLMQRSFGLGNSRTILDLDSSVWQRNGAYKSARSYSIESLLFAQSKNTGAFISIQSWLPPPDPGYLRISRPSFASIATFACF